MPVAMPVLVLAELVPVPVRLPVKLPVLVNVVLMPAPHDRWGVVGVSHGCQGEVGVAFDGARLAGCGLKHHAGCGAGECEDHVFDVVDGFEPADGEEVEGCVGGMFESGLREVGIVVDVRSMPLQPSRNSVALRGMACVEPACAVTGRFCCRHCTPMEAWTDTASSNSWESM